MRIFVSFEFLVLSFELRKPFGQLLKHDPSTALKTCIWGDFGENVVDYVGFWCFFGF